jgi:hypothetical protein
MTERTPRIAGALGSNPSLIQIFVNAAAFRTGEPQPAAHLSSAETFFDPAIAVAPFPQGMTERTSQILGAFGMNPSMI